MPGQYKQVINVVGAEISLECFRGEGKANATVTPVENTTVNTYLMEGWEIIKVVTHTSTKYDMTAIVYVMGLPVTPTP